MLKPGNFTAGPAFTGNRLLFMAIFICMFFTHAFRSKSFAQPFADRNYYLIDSLIIDDLYEEDKTLLDSCLKMYHASLHDTSHIRAVETFIEACLDEKIWPRYNLWIYHFIQKALSMQPAGRVKHTLISSLAQAIYQKGVAHTDVNEFPEALHFFGKSLTMREALGDKTGSAVCLQATAFIYTAQGKLTQALANYQKSLKILESAGDTIKIARCLFDMGSLYQIKLNDFIRAMDCYQKGLKMSEEAGYKRGICDFSGNMAIIKKDQGEFTGALADYERALKIYDEMGEKKGMSIILSNIGVLYTNFGYTSKALENIFKSLKISEEIGDKEGVGAALNTIGHLYMQQNDMKNALEYLQKGVSVSREINYADGIASGLNKIGGLLRQSGELDNALEHYFESLKIWEGTGLKRGIASNLNNIGNTYEKMGNIEKAMDYYNRSKKIYEEIQDKRGMAVLFKNLALLLMNQNSMNESKGALGYAQRSLALAREIGSPDLISDAALVLSEIYEKEKNMEALKMYKLHIVMRDSLSNDTTRKSALQSRMIYDFEKKEALIKSEQEKKETLALAEISKQKVIRNAVAGGTGILAVSSIISFLFYKRRREATFKHEVSEVEMKALRSQMNPHFIFNSLNSIFLFMKQKDINAAANYLNKFSRVMRMILENSEFKEVALAEDLKALELYMQLEAMRMDNKFTFEIKVDDSIDQESTLIPPMILQPFVENAIWHGISNKEGNGKINIFLTKEGDMLNCIVEDDGIGRVLSAAKKVETKEKKSLGMKITKARIDILNRIKKSNAGVELIDLAQGMRVVVKLPLELST